MGRPLFYWMENTMLSKFYFYQNPSPNPHETLALEEYMVDHVAADEIILYLYTHEDTVVIGKNQNAWAECRHEKLISEGGTLARRISGGGAVFHDIGNLNFSFVVGREAYDLHRQLKVILNAVKSFGVDAEFSGRNDIVAQGRKFSGNAFCFRKEGAFHHGTILIGADMNKLSKYLAVPKDKIESKGIESVRSRVVNLDELNKSITPDSMAEALRISFEREYGKTKEYTLNAKAQAEVERLAQRNASWDWQFGQSPKFDISIKHRFIWGGIEIMLSLDDGIIEEAKIYSDAMDADFIEALPDVLNGSRFSAENMVERLAKMPCGTEQKKMIGDLCAFLLERGY